jgi:hypothetical protein
VVKSINQQWQSQFATIVTNQAELYLRQQNHHNSYPITNKPIISSRLHALRGNGNKRGTFC